jgi:hypothetical protein
MNKGSEAEGKCVQMHGGMGEHGIACLGKVQSGKNGDKID